MGLRTPISDDEVIIIIARRHWITLWFSISLMVVAFFIFSFGQVFKGDGLGYVLKIIASVIALGFLIWGAIDFAFAALDRRFSIWVLTDRRLIKEWGIIARNFDETPLARICNVNFNQSMLGRFLNYGSVGVQTAGEAGYDGYREMSNPQGFIDCLDEARKIAQQGGANVKKCPYCAELVKSEARVCRYCGRDL